MERVKKQNRERKTGISRSSRHSLAALLSMILLSAGSLWGTYRALLQNANTMGQMWAQSHAAEEEQRIQVYQTVIHMGMAYMDSMAHQGLSQDAAKEWILEYFEHAKEAVGDPHTRFYAVVNGEMVSSVPFPETADYDYTDTIWYRETLEANGEVVFTDAYKSAVDQEQVVSVAAANSQTGNAIVIDLVSSNFDAAHQEMALLEGSAYYLCDSEGTLLYSQTDRKNAFSKEEWEAYGKKLFDLAESGEQRESGKSVRDLDGRLRGVYAHRASNGWFYILTVPYARLLYGLGNLVALYGVVLTLFGTVGVFFWLRNRRLDAAMGRTNDTIRALGNAYYAVYLLNIERGTYQMIKGSEHTKRSIPSKGDYRVFMEEMLKGLDEKTGKEFEKSFSLENVRKLSRLHIQDYGGDFLRMGESGSEWIDVRLRLDDSLGRDEVVICFRQIDQEKSWQLKQIQLLEEALKAADASEKSQMRFFSNMSHDMRTPLNVIINLAKLGQKPDCTMEKRLDYLEKIHLSSKQLLNLINDILEMSRMQQGRLTLEQTSFDIVREIRACILPFQEQAKQEKKDFSLETDVQTPVVRGDPFRLTQILHNLISNAMKFTPEGGSILVTLRQNAASNANYLIVVEDTGIGMSREFLTKLFLPYERENRFGEQKVSGTGLGMSIVKSLVSQMGGQVTVKSQPGKGTRFLVSLPLEGGEEPAVPYWKEKPDGDRAGEIGKGLAGRHILLVDDNELNLEIARELLEMQDMRVSTASNGREAVEIFSQSAENSIHGILMDMQMPEMDGCEAARAIRELSRSDAARVPIVALTANAFAEDIARTAQAGMDAHLSKPIDAEVLYSTLEELLNRDTQGR